MTSSEERGFSLIEILVMAGVLILISGLVLILIDPVEQAKKNHDNTRILDLQLLSQAIEDYYQDNSQTYPDNGAKTTVRKSNLLPTGSAGPVRKKDGTGWIAANFGDRLPFLPVDPLNSNCNIYRYGVSGDGLRFKLDTILESYVTKMQTSSDGGQDDSHYEVGTSTSSNPIDLGSCP